MIQGVKISIQEKVNTKPNQMKQVNDFQINDV